MLTNVPATKKNNLFSLAAHQLAFWKVHCEGSGFAQNIAFASACTISKTFFSRNTKPLCVEPNLSSTTDNFTMFPSYALGSATGYFSEPSSFPFSLRL